MGEIRHIIDHIQFFYCLSFCSIYIAFFFCGGPGLFGELCILFRLCFAVQCSQISFIPNNF